MTLEGFIYEKHSKKVIREGKDGTPGIESLIKFQYYNEQCLQYM